MLQVLVFNILPLKVQQLGNASDRVNIMIITDCTQGDTDKQSDVSILPASVPASLIVSPSLLLVYAGRLHW